MKNLINLFFELGTLKKIIRSHRQSFLTDDLSDNIASHSHRVSIIAYFLAIAEKADLQKVMTMAIFHDVGETRSGDQNWIHKKYVKVFEDEILEDQLNNVTEDNGLFTVMKEYKERKSLESKIVKDADNLDQFLLVREYMMRGNQEAATWFDRKNVDLFFTNTAKDLYIKIKDTNPSDWCQDLYTQHRR